MRLGLSVGYSGLDPDGIVALARRAEDLGFHSVWTAEAYGSDAVVPLTWIGAHTSTIRIGTAIMQIPARSPAMTAMTAMTLDAFSGGRMLLGLGASGPQVAEGWHGEPYEKPLGRTREYVEIVRAILRRDGPLEHHGQHYDVPYRGPGATGLGKPLKSILHGRPDLPVYLAAMGPRNVALAAEIADGFLPIFFSPSAWKDAFGDALAGAAEGFDVAPAVNVVVGDDVDACRDTLKPWIALYVGGMGAKGRNFYNDLAARYGFEAAAAEIQEHYLDGRTNDAAAAVPDPLVDEIALVGPPARIADRLARWKDSPATTLLVSVRKADDLDVVAAALG